jgi:hypothetical protein
VDVSEKLMEVENLLDAAATDAKDIRDIPVRNAVEMLIRAVGQLADAISIPQGESRP